MYVKQQRYSEAIFHLKDVFEPYQYRIHTKVVEIVQNALDKWDNSETESIQIELIKAIEIAQEYHCF
jgi:hypothetical protein